MTRIQVALLTVGDPGRMTGGYLFHRRLAERAPRHEAEMTFVSIPDLPLPWAVLAGPWWLGVRAMRTADVVVLDSLAATAAAPWLERVRAPIVAMLHQPLGGMDAHPVTRSLRLPFDRRAYRACELLLVASDWLAHQLARAAIPGARLRVLPPGKDPDGESRDVEPVQPGERAALRNGRVIAALCVANWLPRKGISELLEAVATLPDEVVTLHLVGDTATQGSYARRVRRRLKGPDLRARVVVHGLLPPAQVSRMYRAVDAFVLPSFEEPYGTVWGEAMAASLPVIGWRAGNLPFLAEDGQEGLLAPVGDVAALATAIERVARDPGLRARMGSAAAQRAARRPTWDDTAERFFAIVRDVAA